MFGTPYDLLKFFEKKNIQLQKLHTLKEVENTCKMNGSIELHAFYFQIDVWLSKSANGLCNISTHRESLCKPHKRIHPFFIFFKLYMLKLNIEIETLNIQLRAKMLYKKVPWKNILYSYNLRMILLFCMGMLQGMSCTTFTL